MAYSVTNQIHIRLEVFSSLKNFLEDVPCSSPALPSSKYEITVEGIVVFCMKISACFKVLPIPWMGLSTEECH
jgi:hypothetical protein